MSIAITNTSQAAPQSTAAASSNKPAQSQASTKSSIPKDTVQISTAAQTALQEVQETQAQTVHEASHGDHQAQRLLAKEAAAKKA
ncbi:MAG: hypothetical protein ACRD51_07485 [Candidatus Acidiferrum sp.]